MCDVVLVLVNGIDDVCDGVGKPITPGVNFGNHGSGEMVLQATLGSLYDVPETK